MIDESVLLRRYGDDALMYDQLLHLARLSELDHIDLRILPQTEPAACVPYVIMDFPAWDVLGPLHDDVVHIETLHGSAIETDEWIVLQYSKDFRRLHQHVLSPAESHALIRRTAELYRQKAHG
ncbi:Putative DNA-binding protein [[Actinomadura] parvosata subsp. kistnae]|nr:Putative DNA-binding protein [Actinomadura parvosata subsp. kistnae]